MDFVEKAKYKFKQRFFPHSTPRRIVSWLCDMHFRAFTRYRIMHKRKIKWWLVYGIPRSGTSYVTRLIGNCSRMVINEIILLKAGLKPKLIPHMNTRDIKSKVLKMAQRGGGKQLDIVLKTPFLNVNKYNILVRILGEPQRKIFCVREPTAYFASAREKFPSLPARVLEKYYIKRLNAYKEIKGDILLYGPDSGIEDYISFLQPLKIKKEYAETFLYKRHAISAQAPPNMLMAYQEFSKKFIEAA
jgi:hypothetical protein